MGCTPVRQRRKDACIDTFLLVIPEACPNQIKVTVVKERVSKIKKKVKFGKCQLQSKICFLNLNFYHKILIPATDNTALIMVA